MEQIQLITFGRCVPSEGWSINLTRWANRLYYIYSGSGFVWLEDSRKELPLRPRTFYLFSDRVPFHARQDRDRPVDHLYADFLVSPGFAFREPMVFPAEEYPVLQAALAPLEALAAARRPEDTAYAAEALSLALRFIHREQPIPRLQDPRVAEALGFLYETPDLRMTVRELADRVHLEENHFIRLFRRVVGVPPYQYIRTQRLNRGVALLQRGVPVGEAALQAGYGDTASFSKAIRQFTGHPPSALRQR